jgi:hypothetical protein
MDGQEQRIARLSMKAARFAAIRWGGFSAPVDPEVMDRYVDQGLELADEGEIRAWLLALRAAVGLRWIAFHRPDPLSLEDRVAVGKEGLAFARKGGDTALETNALRAIGALLLGYGEIEQGLQLTREMLDQSPDVRDPRERHLAIIESAQTLIWMGGEPERMLPALRSALVLGRELRTHDLCHSTGTLMNALYLIGHWDEVPAALEEHLRTFASDDAGTTCPFALGGFQLGALVLAHRGELDRAREVAASMPKSEAPAGIVEGLQAMARTALGDPSSARELAERVIATGSRNFAEEPPVEIVAELDALEALDDRDALRAFIPQARARASELAIAGPAADRAEAVLALADGDATAARRLLERAIEGFDRLSPFDAARAREALAAIDPSGAATLLESAATTYERLGARPHAVRVRVMLEAVATAG